MEKEIREKLENRSLTPSRDAWNKLEAKLPPVPVRKNSSTRFYWIAAVIIVVILLGSAFFGLSGRFPGENELPVVGNDIQNGPVKQPRIKIEQESNTLPEDQYSKNTPAPTTKEEALQETVAEADTPRKIKKAPVEAFEEKKTVVQTNTEEQISQKSVKNTKMQAEVENVLQQIQAIHSRKGEVTEAEIDTLIMNAQRKLKKNAQLVSGGISKEAIALLDDVEEELDKSFKDRVFEALKNGFIKVRSAVANRDQ